MRKSESMYSIHLLQDIRFLGTRKEIEAVYTTPVNISILNDLILDPMEQERLGIHKHNKLSHSIGRERFPWHESVNYARSKLKSILYITHPIMPALLLNFDTRFNREKDGSYF
ncbi:uncharacterized protein LOC144821103 [Lissotriton helveticus]